MCLLVKSNAKIQIAEKDIVVYKVLKLEKGRFSAPYRRFSYTPGFHYYQTGKDKITTGHPSFLYKGYDKIYEGLHSFVNIVGALAEIKFWNNRVIVQMIIPKGTRYIKGRFTHDKGAQNYVSDHLVFPETYTIYKYENNKLIKRRQVGNKV